jgi:hypothetical protein
MNGDAMMIWRSNDAVFVESCDGSAAVVTMKLPHGTMITLTMYPAHPQMIAVNTTRMIYPIIDCEDISDRLRHRGLEQPHPYRDGYDEVDPYSKDVQEGIYCRVIRKEWCDAQTQRLEVDDVIKNLPDHRHR